MKNKPLFLLSIIFTITCYSQITFEKGYYINNFDQKTDCLIKNIDKRNNPIDFQYKLSESTESKTANIELIKEFGIYNTSKFIRGTVKIDKSSENVNSLSKNRKPIFNEEQLFLKVLIEGKATLYLYENSNLIRYFYKTENSKIEQLVYKTYNTPDNQIGKNYQFRQQLLNNLKCAEINLKELKKLEYKKNMLINFFYKYNKCNNSLFKNLEDKQERDGFNLTLRPRFNNSSLAIQNNFSNSRDTDFGNIKGFGFGIEIEYIFPFNKNKWAIVIEPTYQSFKSEKTSTVNDVAGGKLIVTVDYNSIEFPISLRHYLYLNKDSKIFINTSLILDVSLKSSVKFKRADNSTLNDLKIKARKNLAIGIGYKLYNKYSLEMRYQTNREVLGNYISWNSNYKTFSIIFGYSLF